MNRGNSSLSSVAVTDPSLLRVNVIIARSADYDGFLTESIEAFVRDEADKTVANATIQINVNGRALALTNGSSNYYGAYPHYRLTNSDLPVDANATYAITIVLTNGQEYSLGTIQTLPAITPDQFLPPSHCSRRQPLTLAWQNLEPDNWLKSQWKRWQGETSATSLKISKTNCVKDQWSNLLAEPGSANEADYLAIPIGAGEQEYTIPLSFFEGPLTRFNTLEVQIDSEKSLIIPKPFRAGSVISSVNTTLYRIELTD